MKIGKKHFKVKNLGKKIDNVTKKIGNKIEKADDLATKVIDKSGKVTNTLRKVANVTSKVTGIVDDAFGDVPGVGILTGAANSGAQLASNAAKQIDRTRDNLAEKQAKLKQQALDKTQAGADRLKTQIVEKNNKRKEMEAALNNIKSEVKEAFV